MVNTYKGPDINKTDILCLNGKKQEFNLDSPSGFSRTVFVVYFYRLPKALEHGVKIGMTTCKLGETFWHAIKKRIDEQVHEVGLDDCEYKAKGLEREVIHWGVALDTSDDEFKDYYVHAYIEKNTPGKFVRNQEWFLNVSPEELVNLFEKGRNKDLKKHIYTPRLEQSRCVDSMREYFNGHPVGGRFLLNCKMRFGKCFTTYKYCEDNNINKILILTFVPAVEDSWREDLRHIKKDYVYLTDYDLREPDFSFEKIGQPFVMFLSLQNYLGKDKEKEIKEKIRKLQSTKFDLVVLDEYHFGAWNDRTQETIEDVSQSYQKELRKLDAPVYNVISKLKIITEKTLCLSGTPFKAISRGEFGSTNSFTYSYFDEQQNKYPDPKNPTITNPKYAQFPDMKIFGYNMGKIFPDLETSFLSDDKLLQNKYFSLNKFFETDKDVNYTLGIKFVNEEYVLKWIRTIKGLDPSNQNFPYGNCFGDSTKDSLWLLPSVNSCIALASLLSKDPYFSRYEIINLSAPEVGAGKKAYEYLMNRLKGYTNLGKVGSITLTVNKLTLGVTVKAWSSCFVLKDLASPEQYFQSIFRIQTPYVDDSGNILKKEGRVFDFNIDRAAALLLKYAESEEIGKPVEKMKVADLIVRYLPIYMNGDMSQPISKEVFYQLARYGDTSGIPLSARIIDTNKTTRILDEETISEMLNDPEVAEIIKHVFAHTKFSKPKTRTAPIVPIKGFNTPESEKGREDGFKEGKKEYQYFGNLDDSNVQEEFEKTLDDYMQRLCPKYDAELKITNYKNGFKQGFKAGINAPIKRLQCGAEDGLAFVKKIREKFGSGILYTDETKTDIENLVRSYLNNIDNIPEKYRGVLYKKWYYDSFRRAVIKELKPKVPVEKGKSVEDADNVFKHILARLFEFLFISVYRETTFADIFSNADPNVFLEAVGISKKQFEVLNKYHIFQEDVLNNDIKDFFENEKLGLSIGASNEFAKKHYRNSFNWFGYGVKKQ